MNWRLVFTKAWWLSLNVFVVWTCLYYIIMKRWSFCVRHNFWRVYNGIILQVTHIKIDRRFCYYAMLWSSYEKLALAVALQKKVWNFYSKLFEMLPKKTWELFRSKKVIVRNLFDWHIKAPLKICTRLCGIHLEVNEIRCFRTLRSDILPTEL